MGESKRRNQRDVEPYPPLAISHEGHAQIPKRKDEKQGKSYRKVT